MVIKMELIEQDFSCKATIDGKQITIENPSKMDLYRLAHWAEENESYQYASCEGLIRFWFHKDKGMVAFSGNCLIHSDFENSWGGSKCGTAIGGYIDIFTREGHDTAGKAFAVRHQLYGYEEDKEERREDMIRKFQTYLLCHTRIRLKQEPKR